VRKKFGGGRKGAGKERSKNTGEGKKKGLRRRKWRGCEGKAGLAREKWLECPRATNRIWVGKNGSGIRSKPMGGPS